jgi:LmbE family N-acetylglucosaminyl deacetylase
MMQDLDFRAHERILILCPHPDDETLATGGLIQRAVAGGIPIRVVFVTDGENNPWPQRFLERRWTIGGAERARWGARRREEALAALEALGASRDDALFLGFPDQGLTRLLLSSDDGLLSALAGTIGAWRPSLLLVSSMRDLHPDHSALAVLTRLALERLRPAGGLPAALGYVVHRRGEGDQGASRMVLSRTERVRKGAAILRHASQLALSRRRFLSFASAAEERYVPAWAGTGEASAPIGGGRIEGRALWLAFEGRGASPAGRTLLVAAEGGGGRGARLALRIPSRSGAIEVSDLRTGGVAGEARYYGGRRGGDLVLPLGEVLDPDRVFVKVGGGLSFLDQAGWREVPAPPRRGSLSIQPGSSRPPATGVSTCCVIPCHDVERHCGEVVRRAALHADLVIAVDDGSKDRTGAVLREAASSLAHVRVLSFSANHGKGVALIEAFRQALDSHPFEVLVTLDGDGQHRAEDIPALARLCGQEGTELVIGERRDASEMPFRSALGNTITRGLVRLAHADGPEDTQSGLRALRRGFVETVVRRVPGGRYETEMRILLLALRQGLRVATIPVPTLYLDGNRSSHFRPLLDSLRVFRALLEGERDPGGEEAAARMAGESFQEPELPPSAREASRKVS